MKIKCHANGKKRQPSWSPVGGRGGGWMGDGGTKSEADLFL